MYYLTFEQLPQYSIQPFYNYRRFVKDEIHIKRTPPFSTLLLIFEGTLSFTEDGKTVNVPSGHYYIQRDGLFQDGVPMDDPPVYFYIHFNGEYITEEKGKCLPICGEFDRSEISAFCMYLMSNGHNSLVERSISLYKILLSLYNYNNGITSEEVANKINEFIDENLQNISSLSDICLRFNYSKDHIIRLFKESYGMTPHQYIIGKRISLAKKLLSSSNITIGDIVYKCGWRDSTSFFRAFKKSVGISPKQYRAENYKKHINP